ncbi:hypothetical protein H9P43_009863 [Blastocladiella emersonii ATCC 22665]|nr:hypothetical protein H9P43_009863 [Blastocladiella emersonii ATCC 22665]
MKPATSTIQQLRTMGNASSTPSLAARRHRGLTSYASNPLAVVSPLFVTRAATSLVLAPAAPAIAELGTMWTLRDSAAGAILVSLTVDPESRAISVSDPFGEQVFALAAPAADDDVGVTVASAQSGDDGEPEFFHVDAVPGVADFAAVTRDHGLMYLRHTRAHKRGKKEQHTAVPNGGAEASSKWKVYSGHPSAGGLLIARIKPALAGRGKKATSRTTTAESLTALRIDMAAGIDAAALASLVVLAVVGVPTRKPASRPGTWPRAVSAAAESLARRPRRFLSSTLRRQVVGSQPDMAVEGSALDLFLSEDSMVFPEVAAE